MEKNISIKKLNDYIYSILVACGLTEEYANMVADVYLRATLRFVGHHDIYDFPTRIKALVDKKINASPNLKLENSFMSMESWDADNALGELTCSVGVRRAMELANKYGMGMCSLKNSNHFLSAAPYVQYAADQGYVAFVLTKSAVNMGMPNTENASMSALPLGFAYPTNENFPVMLDFCMAYASVGQLGEKKRNGKTIDAWWGVNEQGDQTNDPAELLKGTRFPIGLHKGYGMSMLGEVLTGVMSGGVIMDQKAQEHGLLTNTSQTIIAIKADAIVPMEKFKEQTSYISKRAKELGGEDLNIPGERSAKSEYKILEKGYIELTNELIEKLNSYADLFNIKKL